ncbi:MAG: divalent-cation tolerance protein CutA [Acidobacteria bacterium]|nr:divalent-cation tolerance protein CutA [Acidobacteriota bacterium]
MTTTGSEKEAALIARTLVERQQAACVNVIPSVRSIYRWKDKTWNEVEQILLIKTTRALFGAVSRTIKELHSYELPDILALPIAAGDEKVLAWIRSCLAPEAAPGPDRPGA